MPSRTMATAPASSRALGVGGEAVHGGEGLALHAVAAHRVDGLGSEADVGDDGDFGGGEATDEFGAVAAAFDFYGLGAGVLDEAEGVADGVVDGGVVGAVGHVGDEEGAAEGAGNGAGVMEHLVEGDGEGVFVAEDDHAERVADEDHVDAGLVDQARGGIVVRGEGGDGMAGELFLQEGVGGDAGSGTGSDDEAPRARSWVTLMVFSSAAPPRYVRMQPETV